MFLIFFESTKLLGDSVSKIVLYKLDFDPAWGWPCGIELFELSLQSCRSGPISLNKNKYHLTLTKVGSLEVRMIQ